MDHHMASPAETATTTVSSLATALEPMSTATKRAASFAALDNTRLPEAKRRATEPSISAGMARRRRSSGGSGGGRLLLPPGFDDAVMPEQLRDKTRNDLAGLILYMQSAHAQQLAALSAQYDARLPAAARHQEQHGDLILWSDRGYGRRSHGKERRGSASRASHLMLGIVSPA